MKQLSGNKQSDAISTASLLRNSHNAVPDKEAGNSDEELVIIKHHPFRPGVSYNNLSEKNDFPLLFKAPVRFERRLPATLIERKGHLFARDIMDSHEVKIHYADLLREKKLEYQSKTAEVDLRLREIASRNYEIS